VVHRSEVPTINGVYCIHDGRFYIVLSVGGVMLFYIVLSFAGVILFYLVVSVASVILFFGMCQ
jgi:hypothetical protein